MLEGDDFWWYFGDEDLLLRHDDLLLFARLEVLLADCRPPFKI